MIRGVVRIIDLGRSKINRSFQLEALDECGRTIGIGDWRPGFGRFIVTSFKEVK